MQKQCNTDNSTTTTNSEYKFNTCNLQYRDFVVKSEGMRPLGRRRHSWEDNIKMDLKEIGGGCMVWIHLAQNRDQW